MAFLADQARPAHQRKGTPAPLEYAILKIAERWHMHPADVDPRRQSPARAVWFWRQIEVMNLEGRSHG